MRRSPLLLATAVLTLLASTAWAPPRAQESTTGNQRTVFVTVLDDKGAAVSGLGPTDFVVKENGRVRPVIAARPATTPMTIVLMLDDSGVALQSIREGAAAFVDGLRLRGVDMSVAIFKTSGRTLKVQDYTSSAAALLATINKLFARGEAGEYLVDGIADISRDFASREVKRPVIVAVGSEGVDFSRSQPNEVLTALMRTKTQLYMVRLGRPVIGQSNALGALRGESNADEQIRFNAFVGQAPDRTGGRAEQLSVHSGFPKAMASVAADLASQYEVTFEVDDTIARDVRLEVSSPRRGLKVRAPTRTGTFK